MYLAAHINKGGYIYAFDGPMVHKETRGMEKWNACCKTLVDAQLTAGVSESSIVIELTEDGGGKKIHIWANQEPVIRERLKRWDCCYGEWEVVVREMHPR